MDPNTQHQFWSKWTFTVREAGRSAPRADVELNAARWLKKGFGTAGRARVTRTILGWRIEALVEGAPAHDPGYVASVREQFQRNFVEKGWGPLASSEVRVKVMSGDEEQGQPRKQMVELPHIDLRKLVH